MIAECSHEAQIAMLQGLASGYVIANCEDLIQNLIYSTIDEIYPCYPESKALIALMNSYNGEVDNKPLGDLLEKYMFSGHMNCTDSECHWTE